MYVLLNVGTAVIHHTIITFSRSDKTYIQYMYRNNNSLIMDKCYVYTLGFNVILYLTSSCCQDGYQHWNHHYAYEEIHNVIIMITSDISVCMCTKFKIKNIIINGEIFLFIPTRKSLKRSLIRTAWFALILG